MYGYDKFVVVGLSLCGPVGETVESCLVGVGSVRGGSVGVVVSCVEVTCGRSVFYVFLVGVCFDLRGFDGFRVFCENSLPQKLPKGRHPSVLAKASCMDT